MSYDLCQSPEHVGSKYEPARNVADIAKDVRQDIKAAVKAGQLPKGKYSVRIERFAGGRAIDITVKSFAEPVSVMNPEWARFQFENNYMRVPPCGLEQHTEAGKAILETLRSILSAYNRTQCDAQTDYFNVSFWAHVNFDDALETAETKSWEQIFKTSPTAKVRTRGWESPVADETDEDETAAGEMEPADGHYVAVEPASGVIRGTGQTAEEASENADKKPGPCHLSIDWGPCPECTGKGFHCIGCSRVN